MKKITVTAFLLLVLIPLAWFLFHVFEGNKPEISIQLPSIYLNRSYEFSTSVKDKGTGLREIRVSIMQHGKEKDLLQKKYDFVGYQGFFLGSNVLHDSFTIPVESWKYGMEDGEAIFRIYVSDYSWRGWNKGNSVYEEHKVIIDTKAPEIEILTKTHNLTRGGSGLIIYQLFEEDLKSGVQVGEHFYPGYSGMFEDKNVFAAFFALSYKQGPGTAMLVTAEDPAGNISNRGFYHYIRDKKFKTDVINISDGFLQRKMPEFTIAGKENQFSSAENPLLEKFLYINKTYRQENIIDIFKPTETTTAKLMWDGPFLRLQGAANRAGYAEHRIYRYKGKEIDRQVHLGIDLASISRAPVPAANSGIVFDTAYFGIFGNSVLIDHGFGLTSIYSHLSSMEAVKGNMIKKGDIIGNTGSTGMAGGDHLHFAMAVNSVFVNPLEWWDDQWIKHNITSKIEEVKLILTK